MNGPLTKRQAAVLAYVVEHPGCTSADVACLLQRNVTSARSELEALTALGYIGRQDAIVPHPYTWWPEQNALIAVAKANP